MTDTTQVDIQLAADLTVIRPGDTAIVRIASSHLTTQQAQQVKERLEERLPGIDVVVIAGCDGIDVYQPDQQ